MRAFLNVRRAKQIRFLVVDDLSMKEISEFHDVLEKYGLHLKMDNTARLFVIVDVETPNNKVRAINKFNKLTKKMHIENMCNFCDTKSVTLMSYCSECEAVYYCSKECQIKDWVNHKKFCNDAKKFGIKLCMKTI